MVDSGADDNFIDKGFVLSAKIPLDLGEVFSKDWALSLPPYDCSIDLIPGAPLTSSRFYSLSLPEREALKAYISGSLASGLIRPTT